MVFIGQNAPSSLAFLENITFQREEQLIEFTSTSDVLGSKEEQDSTYPYFHKSSC